MSAPALHKTLGSGGQKTRSQELTKKLQERQTKKEETKNAAGQPILNPWSCVAIKNEKYAKACSEVFLSGKGAAEISEEFRHFPSLEVVWFNNNRLTEMRNLELNFRIQEVYVDNNRLVSLKGLKKLRFLRMLLARGNQLRNLDKQIDLLKSFSFLAKLDLAENAVADEPDYRLRIIYNLPQVEDLDRSAVKPHDRLRALEVVPNLDKVAEKPETSLRKKSVFQQLSPLEAFCFAEARGLKSRYKAEEKAAQEARHGIDWQKENFKKKSDPRKGTIRRGGSAGGAGAHQLSSSEEDQIHQFLFQRFVNSEAPMDVIRHQLKRQEELNATPLLAAWIEHGEEGGAPAGGAPPPKGGKDPKGGAAGGGSHGDGKVRTQQLQKMEEKKLTQPQVVEALAALSQGTDTYIGRVLTDPCAQDEPERRTRSLSMMKSETQTRSGRPDKDKAKDKTKLEFWDAWKDSAEATVSLKKLRDWVLKLEWSWEEDAALEARLKFLDRERLQAEVTQRDADKKLYSMLYNRMDGVRDLKRDTGGTGERKPAKAFNRTDVLPYMQLESREVVDPFSGRTSIAFERSSSKFRFA